jgi:biopolymer transport protein ExbD
MKRTQDKPVEPTLPITPMLDMTFQLFAFFVFTYSPQSLEGKMDFSLPAAGEFKAQRPEDVDPTKSDTSVELESDLSVEIKTVKSGDTKGNISQILVKQRDSDTPVANLDGLRQYLESARTKVVNKSDIKIGAESNLKYAFVIEVMDTCMKAGFVNVGFSPPPDLATFGN